MLDLDELEDEIDQFTNVKPTSTIASKKSAIGSYHRQNMRKEKDMDTGFD